MSKKDSSFTKKTRRKLWILRIIDMLLLFLPLAVYVVIALTNNTLVKTTDVQKVTVDICVIVAAILAVINVLAQKRLRCPIWIILIGLYIAVNELLLPLIVILAVTTVLDDLVFTPLIDKYRTKLISSKAIDERE